MSRIPCSPFLLLFVSILLAASALPATAQGRGTTPVECGDVIDEPGNYHLEADLHCELGVPPPVFCEDAAITITAPDVHLNGRNHTLSGFPTGVGLRIASITGVTVRNLGVERFGIGVEVSGGGSHRLHRLTIVENSDFYCNTGIGLLLESTEGNRLQESVVTRNRAWGVRIVSSRENLLRNNEIVANRWRPGDLTGNVDLFQAEGNRIVGNDLSRGGLFGARFDRSNGNVLAKNVIDDTAAQPLFGTAVLLSDSDENLVRNNLVDRDPPANPATRFSGIALFGASTGNVVEKNRVEHHDFGISLAEGVQETLVTKNTATTNLVFDARDDNPDCGTNLWRKNELGTTNQPCIE